MNKKIVSVTNEKKMMIAYLKEDMKLSSRKAKGLLKNGMVKLNDKKAYGDSLVKYGDIIQILYADDQDDGLIPKKVNLLILYEDEFLMVVDKPPFISMHPTKDKNTDDTLANGIRYYFDRKEINEPVRFFNRLDMNTSGAVLIPKDGQTHSLLYRFSTNTMTKKYLAIVRGIPEISEGIIKKPISNVKNKAGERIIEETGKKAITEYRVVEAYTNSSLLDVTIKTGRTHQIRVHLSNIGHPILGDCLYGKKTQLINRQALHASKLEFLHPYKKEHIKICSPLPEDMKQVIKFLKKED